MKKTFILAAAFTCAAFTANATLFTDVWSNWSTDYQSVTDYNAGNGTLRSNASSNGDTALTIANGNIFPNEMAPGTPGYQGNAFTPDGLYNSTALPTFTFVNTGSWEGVSSLQLSIIYGTRADSNSSATLTFGDTTLNAVGIDSAYTGSTGQFGVFQIIYTWDFAEAIDLAGFQIEFATTRTRIGYESFTLSAVAVPEPATYALILGGLGLAGVVVARRRRA